MSEIDQATMQAALAKLQEQAQQYQQPVPAGFGQPAPISVGQGVGFGAGAPVTPGMVDSVHIPIKIFHQQMGELRLSIAFSASAISNPQAFMAALQQAESIAMQFGGSVAWYQQRQGGGFGQRGGGYNRGGYNGGGYNGGGYNNGGRY